MGLAHSPSIVTNGLILYLDPGNTKSYSSGSTIYDLSTNKKDGTLINAPTYSSLSGGYFTYNGTNNYITVSSAVGTNLTAATLICWIRRSGAQGNYDGIFFSRSTNTTGLNFYSTTNNIGYHWNDTSTSYNFASNLLVPDNTWCMVGVAVDSTSARLYVNTTYATNTTSHSSTTLNAVELGRDSAISRYMNGDISAAQIYNRALTHAEMVQNFSALRGRFGV